VSDAGGKLMGRVQETGSLIPSLDASNLSYEFEKERVVNPNEQKIFKVVENVDSRKKVPDNLEYLDDFYDKETGTSGTAFRDKNTGKVIVSYTGTNLESNPVEDLSIDIFGIFFGGGFQYPPAFEFYEKLAQKYGADNLIPVGHSLGGNLAMRVALRYNSKLAIVYNSAPLYLKTDFNTILNVVLPKVSDNIKQIELDKMNYTGRIIRIVTENDELTNISEAHNGVFVGEKYTLPISSGHGLDPIVESAEQVAKILRIINAEELIMSAVETVKTEMIRLKITKRSFGNSDSFAHGGVTGSQLIYLDAAQAQILSKGLSGVSEASLELIKQISEDAEYKAHQLYDSLSTSGFVFSLTPEELLSAYAEAGIHYDSIVGEVSRRCNEKQSEAQKITNRFNQLRTNLDTGIQELIKKDKDLEAMFTLKG
jgi:hypothetical protein